MKTKIRKMQSLYRRLRSASGSFWRVIIGGEYASRSYSQYGEDMILNAVFRHYHFPSNYKGFYVDVGAHHPMRFSNTRFFYEKGWAGICIDPLRSAGQLFARWRPRDIFVQAGVAEVEGAMTYYLFDEPALNTFSEKVAGGYTSLAKAREEVGVLPLRRIFAEHLPDDRHIDFLSVDVEGMDLAVLRSNDWSQYRPLIVLIEETTAITLEDVASLDVVDFMKQQGYRAFSRTPSGLFLVDTRSTVGSGGGYLRFTSEAYDARTSARQTSAGPSLS